MMDEADGGVADRMRRVRAVLAELDLQPLTALRVPAVRGSTPRGTSVEANDGATAEHQQPSPPALSQVRAPHTIQSQPDGKAAEGGYE
jgi:hypothetical protein